MTCLYCGNPIVGRLSKVRKWCDSACRNKGRHTKRELARRRAATETDNKRARYLAQCKATSWI